MTDMHWDVETYPLWHGMAQMSQITAWGGPGKQLVRADGCWVEDADGRRYLDARAGIGNVNLGYGRRDIADAIYQQALAVPFACVIRFDRQAPVTLDYARELVDAAPAELTRVRLTHMGSASVENALLMARLYFQNVRQPHRRRIIALNGSFHGTTYLSMSVSGERELHDVFGPMASGFALAPPPWTDPDEPATTRTPDEALAEMVALIEKEGPDRIAAIIVEPVMGSEVVPLGERYLRGLRDLCDETGILLIFDEIVTGFGKVGYLFASDGVGVTPDIMCLAKGITGGYAPMGAVLARERVYEGFDSPYRFFPNGSSTDGHPVCCAAALAALRAYRGEETIPRGRRQGELMLQLVAKRFSGNPLVRDVRGQGLFLGIEIDDGAGHKAGLQMMRKIRMRAEERSVLVQQSKSTIIVMPPLIINNGEIEHVLQALEHALDPSAA